MPISPGSMRVPVSRAKTWQKVPAPCRLVPRSQPLALKITRGPSGNRRWPFRRGQHSRSSSWNLALSTTYIRRALQACLRSLPRVGPKWRTSLRRSPLPPPVELPEPVANIIDFSLEEVSAFTANHIRAWGSEHGSLPEGWLLVRTGWDNRSQNRESFLNRDDDGDPPGLTVECAQWITEEAPLSGIGVETVGIDAGATSDSRRKRQSFSGLPDRPTRAWKMYCTEPICLPSHAP